MDELLKVVNPAGLLVVYQSSYPNHVAAAFSNDLSNIYSLKICWLHQEKLLVL